MKLSIIIPCFNEESTLSLIISKIHKLSFLNKEIILVDDGSTDGTRKLIKSFKPSFVDKVIFHRKNKGKGACIRTAKKFALSYILRERFYGKKCKNTNCYINYFLHMGYIIYQKFAIILDK